MKNPNAKQLALRDPALALLVGAIGASDFGVEFGDDDGWDDEPAPNADFGSDYGYEFGDDWGAEPDASPKSWMAKAKAEALQTQRRALLLEPNKYSRVKVERYTFGMSQDVALGTAEAISMNNNPDTNIRPQRVTMNAPVPGFATIADIKVANVSVIAGGTVDAFQFSAQGVGQSLDLPTLTPANRARITGNYTGLTPTGYVAAATFTFVASFTGPASIVA